MANSSDCFICNKHKALSEYTGEIIEEDSGIAMAHFPFLKDEHATKGRLIVEPIRHVVELSELSDKEAGALGVLLKSGITRLKAILGVEHVYVFRLNDKVAHLHFHLVPRYPGTPKEFWGLKIFEWPGAERVTLQEIKSIAKTLRGPL